MKALLSLRAGINNWNSFTANQPMISYGQGLNRNFLYKETLAAFENGVKLIVIHRCIVSLKKGIY